MNLLIILGIVVILAIIIASMYNSLVKLRNNRENAFADIDVQLKDMQLTKRTHLNASFRLATELSVPEQSMKRLQQKINLVPPSRD